MTSPPWGWVALLALPALVALPGCTAAPGLPPAPPASTVTAGPAADAAQPVADALVRAALADDRSAFLAATSARDPSFADRTRLLYDNLSALPLDHLQIRLRAARQTLSPARQALLGPQAWRQQATILWRLAGEPASASATVWLTFVPDPRGVRLAGTLDSPDGPVSAVPIWWTGPVRAIRDGGLTVLAGAGQPPAAWLARTRAAVRAVRTRVPGRPAASGWAKAVVVEVPASRAAFEAVVGASPGSYARIAAVTLAEGSGASAAVRVVVNPDLTRRLSELGTATVLTHELVHLATRSADSPAPTWAVEGLADQVAFASHPGAAAASTRLLRNQVRRHGAPSRPPTDDEFAAGRRDLDLVYAQAWSVCRYVADAWSPAALLRLYAALDRGTRLDRAAEDQLGVSAADLTAGWRRWLVRQAGD